MLTGLPWWLLQRGSCKVQFVGWEDDRAINSAAEGVCVPAHLAPPGSPQAKQLRHLHAQLSLGQSCHRQKKILHLCAQGHFSHVPTLLPCRLWPSRLLCQGSSPGEDTGTYQPVLAAIPFQSTVFTAALATNSPEYLVLPELLQPQQLHHLHTWPSQGQTQVLKGREASGANPSR